MCETRACVSTVLGFRRVMDPTVRHSALVCVCVCMRQSKRVLPHILEIMTSLHKLFRIPNNS